MKRILIYEDKGLFENIKKDLYAFNPMLVRMQTAYNALEMGTFTSEVMEVLKANGANPVEVDFYENIASQLDSSGITSKLIRQNMVNGSAPLILEFKDAFQSVKNFAPKQYGMNTRPTLNFSLISFNGETFQLDAKAENEILETYCRSYLDSESEKSVYDSLQNFVKAQSEVIDSLQNVGYTFQKQDDKLKEVMENFLNVGTHVSVKPTSIKFAVNHKDMMERRNNLMKNIRANAN